MPDYRKTRAAEEDLTEIWHYTVDKWGEAQADKYLRKIEACFEKIGRGSALLRTFTEDIKFIHCEHYYIFLLAGKIPAVIAVLHERMDLLTRIKKRLG